MLVVSCWMFVVACRLLVVGSWLFVCCSSFDVDYSWLVVAVGGWLPFVGCWLTIVWVLVVGWCWLLAVGCWLLFVSVGCWLSVVGNLLLVARSWLLVVCCRLGGTVGFAGCYCFLLVVGRGW